MPELPIKFMEKDGHVTVQCTVPGCSVTQRIVRNGYITNGRVIDRAIFHALEEHKEKSNESQQ